MLVTRAGTVNPLPIPFHLMEGAHFVSDTHYAPTMYRLRITELSTRKRPLWNRDRAFRARARVSPMSSWNTRRQAQNAVEMTITALHAYSTPTGKCRRKENSTIHKQRMRSWIDTAKGARTFNLQGTRLWRVHVYLESFRIISWAKLAVYDQ